MKHKIILLSSDVSVGRIGALPQFDVFGRSVVRGQMTLRHIGEFVVAIPPGRDKDIEILIKADEAESESNEHVENSDSVQGHSDNDNSAPELEPGSEGKRFRTRNQKSY